MEIKVVLIFAAAVLAGTLVFLPSDEDTDLRKPALEQELKIPQGPVAPSPEDRQLNRIKRTAYPATSVTQQISSPAATTPWWENQTLMEDLKTSFLNEVGDYDNGWEAMYEIAENHLQQGVETPGILLEYVRLTMGDFLDLSPAQMACTRGVLGRIGSNRMALGVDPFGEREEGGIAQSRLEEKILADGLAYSPEYMLDALTYRTGDVPWTDKERQEFAAIRLDFLLELIPIQEELDNRRNAAASFLAKRAPDAVRESGFLPGLNALDPKRAILERNLQDLNRRYLEESRRFVQQ